MSGTLVQCRFCLVQRGHGKSPLLEERFIVPIARVVARNQYRQPCGGAYSRVYDVLKVPKDLKPGEYVLGWRYDCEGTAQVWQNCADILVEA